MFETLFLAILPIIGVIIGALLGSIIPYHMRKKAEYKSFLKNKLEDLYDDLNHWVNTIFMIPIINFYLVFNKAIDWNGYLDKIIESNPSRTIRFFKYEIILYLYFRELLPDFNNLTEAIHDIRRFTDNEIKNTYLSGIDINIHRSEYDDKVKNITDLSNKLKDKIKDIALKL